MGSFCIFLAKRCSSRSFQALPWLIWVYRIYLPFLLWPSVSYSCRSCLQSETYSICGCVVFFSPFECVLENFWDILTVFLLSPHRDLFFLCHLNFNFLKDLFLPSLLHCLKSPDPFIKLSYSRLALLKLNIGVDFLITLIIVKLVKRNILFKQIEAMNYGKNAMLLYETIKFQENP